MPEEKIDTGTLSKKTKEDDLGEKYGHLKIFFGYAAGVGKTYSMLKAAHAAKHRGIDVVVGYVEPHERPQTIALMNGLEKIPILTVEYKGIKLNEFHIDAALKRKPQLILVDELAHTNADGCRHTKRYQDITELLRNGIDVYTTINVQHIESLNDVVASITGITVKERIPDYVFDNASQVELVDIEPEELLNRLNAGIVYQKAQAQKALLNFFDIKNLTALREIALRRCADRVNKMSEYDRLITKSDYTTNEHILVCLSSSPSNAKIIRTAARLASAFKGSFTALFVETPAFSTITPDNKKRLRKNMHLAQQLGATIETVYGEDVPLQISEFARLSGVSKIVVGRSNATRKYFWSKPTLTERLSEYAPNLDIYIIPDKNTPSYSGQKEKKTPHKFVIADLLKSIMFFSLATAIGYIFHINHFSEANIITIYILFVLITAITTSERFYSVIASVISVVTFNFFFTMPKFTFNASDIRYTTTFFTMFFAAFITSTLATKLKSHAKQFAETAYRTKILLETNQLLQKSATKSEIISATANQLCKLLEKTIVFYFAEDGMLQSPTIYGQTAQLHNLISENERAVATWVFKNNTHAGASTNTLGSAQCLYLAIRVHHTVYGVVGIALEGEPLNSFEHSLMLSILGECALALENQKSILEREDAAVLAKNEQLKSTFIRVISNELHTPLTSISSNANILLSSENSLLPEAKASLYADIYDDTLWLINLVENLLTVTRIEEGSMQITESVESINQVIIDALQHVHRKKAEHKIIVIEPTTKMLAKIDAKLIIQVIVNLIDNAIKYTPMGSTIIIKTQAINHQIIVEISDNGVGIPDSLKDKIFDMLYTTIKAPEKQRSLGLGLTLCRSIVAAHGGQINVFDNIPTGTTIRFTLPSGEVIPKE